MKNILLVTFVLSIQILAAQSNKRNPKILEFLNITITFNKEMIVENGNIIDKNLKVKNAFVDTFGNIYFNTNTLDSGKLVDSIVNFCYNDYHFYINLNQSSTYCLGMKVEIEEQKKKIYLGEGKKKSKYCTLVYSGCGRLNMTTISTKENGCKTYFK